MNFTNAKHDKHWKFITDTDIAYGILKQSNTTHLFPKLMILVLQTQF